MTIPTHVKTSAAVLLVAAASGAGSAQAESLLRTVYSNPVGLCQAALPAFEGQVRKRPLAVQNEGASNAFITCSFASQTNPNGVTV